MSIKKTEVEKKEVNRINVYKHDDCGEKTYLGWFDKNAAIHLADETHGDAYKYYTDIFLTKSEKLVRRTGTNVSGSSWSWEFCSIEDAIETIIESGTAEGREWLESAKNADNLKKFEI